MSKNARIALWKTCFQKHFSPSFPHNLSTPCGKVCGLFDQIVEKATTSKAFSGFYPTKVDISVCWEVPFGAFGDLDRLGKSRWQNSTKILRQDKRAGKPALIEPSASIGITTCRSPARSPHIHLPLTASARDRPPGKP